VRFGCFRHLRAMDDESLALDDLPAGSGNRISLWMFGFLY